MVSECSPAIANTSDGLSICMKAIDSMENREKVMKNMWDSRSVYIYVSLLSEVGRCANLLRKDQCAQINGKKAERKTFLISFSGPAFDGGWQATQTNDVEEYKTDRRNDRRERNSLQRFIITSDQIWG